MAIEELVAVASEMITSFIYDTRYQDPRDCMPQVQVLVNELRSFADGLESRALGLGAEPGLSLAQSALRSTRFAKSARWTGDRVALEMAHQKATSWDTTNYPGLSHVLQIKLLRDQLHLLIDNAELFLLYRQGFLVAIDGIFNQQQMQVSTSPVMWAAFAGHVHIMQFFRNYDNTYPNATALTDGTYSNVIGLAAMRERKNVIEYLNGYPCDIPDADGRSPLWYATSNGHLESLKLLQKNASLRNRRDNQGFTPLAIAAYKGHSKIVYLLRDIADLSVPTHAGHTALHLATSGGPLECVKLFLHPSINVLGALTIRNTYAFAQSLGYHEICRVFEVYGLGSI